MISALCSWLTSPHSPPATNTDAGMGYGVVIEPNYDEEMKLFGLIGRDYGGLLFQITKNLSSTCGMTGENFRKGLEATFMTWIRSEMESLCTGQ